MTTPRSATRRVLSAAGVACAVVVVCAAAAGVWFRGRIAGCLPMLDGSSAVRGLSAPVRISRDALGIPTVEGASRIDVARATGWLHAQDRFFQMDILRRRGAGELAELFGAAALPLDRAARMHGFRGIARLSLARESTGRRALLEAYAEGVNAGLAALASKPWEYVVLRTEPRPWLPEDIMLISFAMTLEVEDPTARYQRTLGTIRSEIGPAALAFFAPLMTPSDAALDGSVSALAPFPPASEIDLRQRARTDEPVAGMRTGDAEGWGERGIPGSNSFAVSGAHGAGGGAIVASDMHLGLAVPNIWYRMRLKWPGHDETGVTLPGAPNLVAGSTGKIAWGFTTSYAGTGDVVVVDASVSPELYHGPKGRGLLPFEKRVETVAVRGAKPVTMEFQWTAWGPILGEGAKGTVLAYRWTEDDPAATNEDMLGLEDASDVRGAIAVAHEMGIPAQNFVVVDSAGQIGWTVAGLLPKRFGYDGRLPAKWTYGDRGWDGTLAPGDVPSIVAPAGGRLWTANNRTMGGGNLGALGDAGYDIAARARQIRDDLDQRIRAGGAVAPPDMLAIQLDDRALLLESWHALLLRTLTPEAISAKPSRAALLAAAQTWEGKADTGSASYRIVRAFRLSVAHRVLDPVFASCTEAYPEFSWSRLNYEEPLEAILRERPINLLDAPYSTWDDLLVGAADDVSALLAKAGLKPAEATWGLRNTAQIEHPFARMLPRWASSWLSMPADPLPGDANMPRVQDTSFGASERFDVSPGREAEGIFHMPGGQCANPLSPYFRAGHEAWVRGDPTPFLPGPAEHTLELHP